MGITKNGIDRALPQSSSDFNVRYMPEGAIFDTKGSSGFVRNDEDLFYVIGLCNSIISMVFLKFLAPTMDYNKGAVEKIPTLFDESKRNTINGLVGNNISISKDDWDSFETSWEFKKHPLA